MEALRTMSSEFKVMYI